MPEIDRLNSVSGRIELDFVEREQTPRELLKLGIHIHVVKISLSIQLLSLIGLVSNVVGRRFTIGSRKPAYSPLTVRTRITSPLMKP